MRSRIHMPLALIGIAVLLVGSSAPEARGSARGEEITGETLLEVCARMDARSQHECDGYLHAAFETARMGIAILERQAGREPWNACVPGQIDRRLRRGFVLAYLVGRPSWRKLPSSDMVRLALMHAYPCD
jgi:Rap1a immunity proteins